MSTLSTMRRRRKVLNQFARAVFFALAPGLAFHGFRAMFAWDEYFVIAVLTALALVLAWALDWRREGRDERREAAARAAEAVADARDRARESRDRDMDDRAAARDHARMGAMEEKIADLETRMRAQEQDAAYQRGVRDGAESPEGEGE